MKVRPASKELRALTLLELLVVIVCIAILVGMLEACKKDRAGPCKNSSAAPARM